MQLKSVPSISVRSIAIRSLLPLLILFAVGCQSEEKVVAEQPRLTDPAAQPDLRGTRVEVAVVEPSLGGLTLRVPGEVEGIRDAMLAAPMGGYVELVGVKEGDEVKRGAVLARVDSETYSTRLLRAEVEKRAAEREHERTRKLAHALPAAELDSADDRVKSAAAALRELQVAATRSVITAPFSGVVVHVDAEVGEVVSPGQPMFRLVQLEPVRVSVALSDRDVALAQVGMPATVDLAARSGMYTGKVVQISQAADLKTRSFEALVEVENKERTLLPGMIAQVSLSSTASAGEDAEVTDPDKRLLISQDWLVTKPTGVGVFVAKDGKASWRDVKLGGIVRREVEVLDGLGPGDALVIVGHRSLADGDPVLIHRQGKCCENGRAVFTN